MFLLLFSTNRANRLTNEKTPTLRKKHVEHFIWTGGGVWVCILDCVLSGLVDT